MRELDCIDIPSATSAYFVANSPLYLLRKLRGDLAVTGLANSTTGEQLINALRKAALKDPDTLADRVRPFVLLVALAKKENIKHLREATSIKPSIRYDWFDYVRRFLIEAHRPTHRSILDVSKGANLGFSTLSLGAVTTDQILVIKK